MTTLFVLHTYTGSHIMVCVCVLHLFQACAEAVKHSLHVASLLHRDDSGVILFIDPDQEGLRVVMPGVARVENTKRINTNFKLNKNYTKHTLKNQYLCSAS